MQIGCELKGKASTDIQISGFGTGLTEAQAVENSLQNMKKLQTVLITGSLPVKLEIMKMDSISPTLGQEFLDNVAFIVVITLLAVIAVVFIRYRKAVIIVPMVFTLLSELVLILGFAVALVGWNLDLAAIAGIILTIGTGVDHLVIITDETIRGEKEIIDWKRRIKNAMFIVIGAYLTVFASLLPLFW